MFATSMKSSRSTRYNGLSRLVTTQLSQITIVRRDFGGSDNYEAFDRFGRRREQYWRGLGETDDVDRMNYAHDAAGNRTERNLSGTFVPDDERDQQYEYDDLHRLIAMQRGEIDGGTIPAKYRVCKPLRTPASGVLCGSVSRSAAPRRAGRVRHLRRWSRGAAWDAAAGVSAAGAAAGVEVQLRCAALAA
jgi:hypothetical protein